MYLPRNARSYNVRVTSAMCGAMLRVVYPFVRGQTVELNRQLLQGISVFTGIDLHTHTPTFRHTCRVQILLLS